MKIILIVLYVLANLGIGWYVMRRNRNVSDFFLGGRNIGPWLSAFAYGTTYFSAVLFVGYAGQLGWNFGLHTMWIVAGNVIVGSFLAWKILGARTRNMTARLNALTMPEFLEARYGSHLLKAFSALVIFCLLVPYSASVYMGLSYLFEKNLGLSYEWSLYSLAILTGLYIIMGGYFALTITDFVRGIIEIFGVAVMVAYLVGRQGGFAESLQRLTEKTAMPAMHAPALELPGGISVSGAMILFSLVLVTSLGPWGLPQMVQKFYSIKSEADIARTMWVASAFALLIAFGAYFTGALTHLFYTVPPVPVNEAGKPMLDRLMPVFLVEQTPPAVALIILLLIFSASMSSLSSLVLVASSAIVIDLLGGKRKEGKQHSIRLMRVFCAVFVGLSLYVALGEFNIIMNLMVMSWGALAGSFLAPFIYGLFWKRATRQAAIVSFFTGLGLSLGLSFYWGRPGIPIAGAIAIVTPLVVMPIVSLLTPRMEESRVRAAFGDSVPAPEEPPLEAVTPA